MSNREVDGPHRTQTQLNWTEDADGRARLWCKPGSVLPCVYGSGCCWCDIRPLNTTWVWFKIHSLPECYLSSISLWPQSAHLVNTRHEFTNMSSGCSEALHSHLISLTGDYQHECAADKPAAADWWYHVIMNLCFQHLGGSMTPRIQAVVGSKGVLLTLVLQGSALLSL